jgi:hypothetical protein
MRSLRSRSADQVKISRTATPGADRQISRKVRFGAGRERAGLLVSHVNPFDLALASKRVRDAVEAVPDDAIYALHACGDQRVGELIRYRP